jgi:hypothetical protein
MRFDPDHGGQSPRVLTREALKSMEDSQREFKVMLDKAIASIETDHLVAIITYCEVARGNRTEGLIRAIACERIMAEVTKRTKAETDALLG